MKILCIGGGPASLSFALNMKLQNPKHEISILERNPYYLTHGFGVILSQKTVDMLIHNDKETAEKIIAKSICWSDINIFFYKWHLVNDNKKSFNIARLDLLYILQERCKELGVNIFYEKQFNISNLNSIDDIDLLVIGDGANSKTREYFSKFLKVIRNVRPNKYKWLGTRKLFNKGFNFIFEKTDHGLIWGHCYQFNSDTSTFVVECALETWHGLGFSLLNESEALKKCEQIFSKHLSGYKLISNNLPKQEVWNNFNLIKCENWYYKNVVMLGDAVRTVHFSVGSGTRLALEDAQELSKCLNSKIDLTEALHEYQNKRNGDITHITKMGYNSMRWFENINEFKDYDSTEFVKSVLKRRHDKNNHY